MVCYDKYEHVVSQQIDKSPKQWDFKSNLHYRTILEHVNAKQGKDYQDHCVATFSELWSKHRDLFLDVIKENDLYGKPMKITFDDSLLCSPTNQRYLYQALTILSLLQNQTINFIEIGGGYGGLCLFIQRLAHLFNCTIQSYTIFDLDAVGILQKQYLVAHGINISTGTLETIPHLSRDSFLISAYALSELPASLRTHYRMNVLEPYCAHGFIAWNINPYQGELDHLYSIKRMDRKPKTDQEIEYMVIERK
jgi:hypothetical protein